MNNVPQFSRGSEDGDTYSIRIERSRKDVDIVYRIGCEMVAREGEG